MGFNESMIKFSCYIEESHNSGLQFRFKLNTNKYKHQTEWCYRFLNRNILAFRSGTNWSEATAILLRIDKNFYFVLWKTEMR